MSCISSPAVSSYILALNYQFKLFQTLCLNTFDPTPMTGDLSFSPTLRNPNWHLRWLWFNPALCGDKEERGEQDFFLCINKIRSFKKIHPQWLKTELE